MPTILRQNHTFDARPDRIDYRDLPYRPPLVSLPARYPSEGQIHELLPHYQSLGLVLDQGREGACTGFGLAALINYLQFRIYIEDGPEPAPVSMRMLYHNARVYDEWAGEDYDGSSCRGAMKGWFHHGVTTEQLWPYQSLQPKAGWQQEAAARPLGAYYRINKDSINDIQAAIKEVGAVYASAQVHEGWYLSATSELKLIAMSPNITGGHAFALVGYTPEGFIVQNSWGKNWGYKVSSFRAGRLPSC